MQLAALVWLMAILTFAASTQSSEAQASQPQAPQASTSPVTKHSVATAAATSELPRGQKLILKDGTFQFVREYSVEGDRVRYYSLDTHEWEAMPAALVDWDKTKAEQAQEQKHDAAIVSAIDAREKEKSAQTLDVDASIEVGPKVFLPPDVGLFAFDGKTVSTVPQAEIQSALNKRKFVEKVLVPVPIIPTEQNVTIAGTRAKFRLTTGQPEFYMRTADGREPAIDLIRVKVKGDRREVENVDTAMGSQHEKRDSMALQRWTVAPGVYRFTLGQSLTPGEYVIAENVGDQGVSMYVWDFGVDGSAKK